MNRKIFALSSGVILTIFFFVYTVESKPLVYLPGVGYVTEKDFNQRLKRQNEPLKGVESTRKQVQLKPSEKQQSGTFERANFAETNRSVGDKRGLGAASSVFAGGSSPGFAFSSGFGATDGKKSTANGFGIVLTFPKLPFLLANRPDS